MESPLPTCSPTEFKASRLGPLLEALAGFEPGDRFPAVVDGYWILLKPLPPGLHTVTFSADFGDTDVSPDFGCELYSSDRQKFHPMNDKVSKLARRSCLDAVGTGLTDPPPHRSRFNTPFASTPCIGLRLMGYWVHQA